MLRKLPWAWIAPLPVLFALTGGFGMFVPRILGLGSSEWSIGRVVLPILLVGLPILFFSSCAFLGSNGRSGGRVLGWCAVLVASAVVNMWLDQDPIAAGMNWTVHTLRIDPEWGYNITSHEYVFHDDERNVFYVDAVGGPGLSAMLEERDRSMRFRLFHH